MPDKKADFEVTARSLNDWTHRHYKRMVEHGSPHVVAVTITIQALARECARMAIEHLPPDAYVELCVRQYAIELKAKTDNAMAAQAPNKD
jgi:hypothetical protein